MKTPEQIIKDLRTTKGFQCDCGTCKNAWDTALKEIHAYANQKRCECPDSSGATTNWTCNDCSKIVDDIDVGR